MYTLISALTGALMTTMALANLHDVVTDETPNRRLISLIAAIACAAIAVGQFFVMWHFC